MAEAQGLIPQLEMGSSSVVPTTTSLKKISSLKSSFQASDFQCLHRSVSEALKQQVYSNMLPKQLFCTFPLPAGDWVWTVCLGPQ